MNYKLSYNILRPTVVSGSSVYITLDITTQLKVLTITLTVFGSSFHYYSHADWHAMGSWTQGQWHAILSAWSTHKPHPDTAILPATHTLLQYTSSKGGWHPWVLTTQILSLPSAALGSSKLLACGVVKILIYMLPDSKDPAHNIPLYR